MRSGNASPPTIADGDLSDVFARSSPDLSAVRSRPARSWRMRLNSSLSSRVSFMLPSILLPARPSRRRDGLGVDVIQGPGFHVVLGQPFKVDVDIPKIETGIGGNCGGVGHFVVGHRAGPKYRAQLSDFGAKLLDLGVKQRIRAAPGHLWHGCR